MADLCNGGLSQRLEYRLRSDSCAVEDGATGTDWSVPPRRPGLADLGGLLLRCRNSGRNAEIERDRSVQLEQWAKDRQVTFLGQSSQ